MVTGNCNDCMQLSNGIFYTSGSTTPLYLDVVNEDNLDISSCVLVTAEVIRTYPEMIEYDECGCPINECDKASLRINIRRNEPPAVDCGYDGFSLDANGLVLFSLYNGTDSYFMNSQCCSALGFTPVLQNGIYVCRWQEEAGICDGYTPTIFENGYQVFVDPEGNNVRLVPAAECCPVGTIPELASGGWFCKEDRPVEITSCSGYTLSEYQSDGTIIFNYNGVDTTVIPPECCTAFGYTPAQENGKDICKVSCQTYVTSSVGGDGYIIFVKTDSSTFVEVPLVECCPVGSTPVPTLTVDGVGVYKCRSEIPAARNCRYITFASFTNAGNSEAQPAAFNGKYCDGTNFNFNRTLGPNEMSTQSINQCVDTDSLTYSTLNAAPHYNDSIDCTPQFFFRGIWNCPDIVHDPEVNCWVDYIGLDGNPHRQIIGCRQNGCQQVFALSIIDTNGVFACDGDTSV